MRHVLRLVSSITAAAVVAGAVMVSATPALAGCYTASGYDAGISCSTATTTTTSVFSIARQGDHHTSTQDESCAQIIACICILFALIFPPHGDIPGLLDCPPYDV